MRKGMLLCMGLLATSSVLGSSLEAVYTADYYRNVDGGIREDSAYLQNIDLTFQAEIQAIFGNGQATVFAYALYNDNSTLSDTIVGDAQVVSNIDASRALRVYELWYQQSFGDVSTRFGLYDLNSEFDALDTAGLFINSSHGIGSDFSQTGQNGPSIFPVTSLALRLNWDISESATLRYVILDGVPGDPNDFSQTTIDLSGTDGALQTVEIDTRWRDRFRLAAGYWRYSADFDFIDRFDPMGNNLQGDGNDGWYVLGEAELFPAIDSVAVNGFIRYGQAEDAFNDFGSYVGAGIVIDAPFGRTDSQLGLAVASVRTGDAFQRISPTSDSRETNLELTYSFPVTSWLRLQPDVQYVINPGVDPALRDALVVGVRIEIGGRWETGR